MNVKTKIADPVDIAVSDEDEVKLTVVIGNAQNGGSIVRFDGNPKIIAKGQVEGLALGQGGQLKGKKLLVTTNVLDHNPATMRITIKHQFENGTPPETRLSDKVDNPGDIFSWVTTYNFK
ncbi:hypothetical protein [Mucilaginibacter sp. BT774]|uniref:hypothetical protein n=1 Tax=Mucilaginibacter sp. BT774 TaxID=3062276 RepID=UPI002674A9B7|nr:hypothetical protein [Mucilaginibacter sp. BT774]MDO3627580.1 hypothetical protein [Mucilaginibacter sp. BT774]